MPKTPAKKYQPSPKVLACRENGRKGGLARAKKVSAEAIKEWSAKGGKKTADTYSTDYYAHIGKKRLHVGRFRKPVVKTTKTKKEQLAA